MIEPMPISLAHPAPARRARCRPARGREGARGRRRTTSLFGRGASVCPLCRANGQSAEQTSWSGWSTPSRTLSAPSGKKAGGGPDGSMSWRMGARWERSFWSRNAWAWCGSFLWSQTDQGPGCLVVRKGDRREGPRHTSSGYGWVVMHLT